MILNKINAKLKLPSRRDEKWRYSFLCIPFDTLFFLNIVICCNSVQDNEDIDQLYGSIKAE